MRIAIIEVGQETCSFSPVRTTVETFATYGLYEGEDVVSQRSTGPGAVAGFFLAATEAGIDLEPAPIISAWAGANGPLDSATLTFFVDKVVAGLESVGPIDGIFMSLHGAAAADNEPDVEGALLAAARSVVGMGVPLVTPLDHHANVTQRMVDLVDGLVGHRTQPHDSFDTGKLAAELLFKIVQGQVTPTVATCKIPMITHQEQFLTSQGPMKAWFDKAREFETRPGVLSVSPFPIQCWLDVPEAGWTVVVYTDNDPALARTLADELAEMAWEMREDFWVFESISPAEAVAAAEQAERGLVILSDTGDSVFGGATGDSTVLLREMLAQQIQSEALLPMVDPEAVEVALAAGVGETVTLLLGGKLDPLFGQPLEVTAKVVAFAEGPLEAAVISRNSFDMGRTVLLEIGPIKVVVSEHRGVGGNHPIVYRRFGIEPADAKMIVLKTASNFQYYADMTSQILRVDTPGPTMSHLEQFEWRHAPRPIYPLDELPEWKPGG